MFMVFLMLACCCVSACCLLFYSLFFFLPTQSKSLFSRDMNTQNSNFGGLNVKHDELKNEYFFPSSRCCSLGIRVTYWNGWMMKAQKKNNKLIHIENT